MTFKTVPAIGPRYWAGLSLASICGCNMGDFVPDILRLHAVPGLTMLALLFAAVSLAERASPWRGKPGGEAFYWLAILVVRTAATDIADLSVARFHLGYAVTAAILMVPMVCLAGSSAREATVLVRGVGPAPKADGRYWLTMLVAGTLGTVAGDGILHAIHPLVVGALASTAIGIAATSVILAWRARLDPAALAASTLTYWAAVVTIRWWGTNVGDIAAHVTSLPLSMIASGLLLAALLIAWRRPRESQALTAA